MVRCLLFSSFLLFALFRFVTSSGHMNIYLKSSMPINAQIETADGIYFPRNKKVYNLTMKPNEKWSLQNVPVDFGNTGLVYVHTGKVDRFGIEKFTIKYERWHTEVMVITSENIRLPFTGFRIEFKCDKNWHGKSCDQFCDDHEAALIGKRCNHVGRLSCPKGYRGWNCDQHISLDDPSCNCQNNGTCVSNFWWQYKHDSLICECPYGFEGEKCEKESYSYRPTLNVEIYAQQNNARRMNEFADASDVANEYMKTVN